MAVVEVHRRFSDLDPLGHINNVVYHDYLQEARVGLMGDLASIVSPEFAQVIVKQEIHHLKSLAYSREPIRIEVILSGISRASYSLDYRVFDEHGELAATARSQLAIVDPTTGRPIRIPDSVVAQLTREGLPGQRP